MAEKQIRSSNSENITLLVDDVEFACNKLELMKHSDYFKAMFDGNFVERNQYSVRLQGIDSKSLNTILILLRDSSHLINEEDILLVLEAACMLQFSNIREICVDRIRDMLTPFNCINIWFITEQLEVEELYLKAKYLALVEFDEIKNTNCLLQLNLKQLHMYLADINLQCKNESDILQICMKWWYENSLKDELLLYSNDSKENKSKNILYLLSVVNYRKLSDNDFREMLRYHNIADNQDIVNAFSYLTNLKNGKEINLCGNLRAVGAHILKGTDRLQQSVLCFLVNNVRDDVPSKRLKISISQKDMTVIYHDCKSNTLKKLINVEYDCDKLTGFKMLCYKQFIFCFGGEYKIGRGDWNRSFWVYDSIKEKWRHKTVIPYTRRHFEACIVEDHLYIIGGAGNYRIIQDNMFWYNFKNDIWSKQITLPCLGREAKCCCLQGKLFLLSACYKRGHLFDHNSSTWIRVDINDENNIIPTFPNKFVIFSYNGNLFFKGSHIIELKLEDQILTIINYKVITTPSYDSMESVLCNDNVYTLYRRKPNDENCRITLEKLSLSNYETEYIFENLEDDSVIKTEDENFKIKAAMFVFTFLYWRLVKGNCFVNNFASEVLCK